MRTRVLAVEPDPDPAAGAPAVLRIRVCVDCGELMASTEQLAPLPDVQRRFTELARERMSDGRAVRKSLARMPAPA